MLLGVEKFDTFVQEFGSLFRNPLPSEDECIAQAEALMSQLVAVDDWLPDEFAQPGDAAFKQYMLYADSEKVFTVLGVVWAPGQYAGPHDHRIWGVVGQLRGEEFSQEYHEPELGQKTKVRETVVLKRGHTCSVAPHRGDIHDVENRTNGISISIHAYAGDLAEVADKRRRFNPDTGEVLPFLADYH